MGLFFKRDRKHSAPKPHHKLLQGIRSRFRLCRIEQMESRQLLSVTVAPLHIAATYFEDSNNFDQASVLKGTSTPVADLFQVSFTGGAAGSELTQLRIDADNTFFHTAEGGPGVYGDLPLTIVSHDGFQIVSSSVANGGTSLVLNLSGFTAGDKLVFSIDVDENGNLQPNAVVEGAEFEGATLTGAFTAPHMQDLTTPAMVFYDKYSLEGTGLEDALPNNDYDNAAANAYVPEVCSSGPVYTAAASGSVTQSPLPITLSGTVFNDLNANNHQDSGDLGIGGVTLALNELDGDDNYVATGKTTTTDANGSYTFTGLLPGTYRVIETQPSGYLSVGDTPGTVGGQTRGVVTTVDILSSINLDGGDDSVHNDYAEVQPASLSGYVYVDANNNGVYDSGETPIADVPVNLITVRGDGVVVAPRMAMTDSNGYYRFDNLLPGEYAAAEIHPDGYYDGLDAAGTAGGTAHNPGDIIDGVHLIGGQAGLRYDFGELLPASLSGYAYVDANNNGIYDEGETPIAAVTMTLLDANGDPTDQTAVTDDAGFYRFDNLAPGAYGVAEAQPDGYLDGLDAAGTAGGSAHNPGDLINGVNLSGGQSGLNYNFGELEPASLTGYVYVDANNNGVYDESETPIAGAVVTLLDANGTSTGQTTVTDDTGYYYFDGLMPGTYGVAETQPGGYLDGLDAAGSVGGTVHNPGDLINGIALAGGVSAKEYNFGELLPASIRGKVYVDNNGNNTYDSSETLLGGVTIHLLDGNGNRIALTTTDADGKYAFTNLTPGTYGVEEIQPANYLEGNDQVGSAGGQLDGTNRILNAPLSQGVNGVNYDFWEVTPAKISGYVFQDGPAIKINKGDPMPDVASLRDGKLTSDDKMLAGVTIELCDGSGVPMRDAQNKVITTTTDANGYYEFNMLQPGVYSVVEIQPANYLSGIDTVGSKGGLVVNRYSAPDAGVMETLAVDASGSAIVRIWINPGDSAVQYNFSEVLVETKSNPPSSLHEPTPFMDPPTFLGGGEPSRFMSSYSFVPEIVRQATFGGGGLPGGYTWHLSVIDAGQPRQEVTGDEFVQVSQLTENALFDPVSWTGADLAQSQWILADKDGVPIKKFTFGMKDAKPVAGDWDGSGVTKIGVFIDGLWFLDINGDGVWDKADLWVKLGKKGDQPVEGDWNGDGKTDIGIFGPTWIGDEQAIAAEPGLPSTQNTGAPVRPKNVPPDPTQAAVGYRTMKKGHIGKLRSDLVDHVFKYGENGDVSLAGDWSGDGIHTIGVYRNGAWYLDINGNGRWDDGDRTFEYGQPGDLPVVGDWTGDGITKVGVYRNGTFHLDTNDNHKLDDADKVIHLGRAGDKPIAGDWTGDGIDKVGVYEDGAAATNVPLQARK